MIILKFGISLAWFLCWKLGTHGIFIYNFAYVNLRMFQSLKALLYRWTSYLISYFYILLFSISLKILFLQLCFFIYFTVISTFIFFLKNKLENWDIHPSWFALASICCMLFVFGAIFLIRKPECIQNIRK